MEDYRTIRGTAVGEYEEKKSRFIAQLSFADSEEAAVAFLEQVRAANRTARHNVYAYRLREGNRERYSDDGEPAKTAGTPALEVLQHSGLTDLIVVITRYFGGVLLGTGGLVRAYTTATARALENAEVVTVRSVVELRMTVDYSLYERASLLIDAAGAKQAAPEFADRVTLRWQMPEHTEGPLLEQLYLRYRKLSLLQGVLTSLRPAVVAMIASAGVSILVTAFWDEAVTFAGTNWRLVVIFASSLLLLRRTKLSPILVMTLAGAANLLLELLPFPS